MEVKPGYKQTEVGVIPDDWDVNCLGDRASFRTGPFGSALHKSDYVINGVPVINPMHIIDGDIKPSPAMTITQTAATHLSEFCLKAGEIVIGRRGDMGRCAVVQPNQAGWLCGTGSMIIRFGPMADAGYIQRVLSSPRAISAIEATSVGSTMINLNQSTLARLIIQFPLMSEQRAIAAALSDVDALIDALNRLIAKKRDLKQAAMQQLLTGQTRLPGFHDEWEVIQFNDLADKMRPWTIVGGPFGSNFKASDYVEEGVRIIQLQNIGDGRFLNDYAIYTSETKADELLSNNIYPGEIILSKMGNPVARACLMPSIHRRYLMASDGIRLVVDPRQFDTRFVLEYINSPYFRRKAIEASTGSTRQRIGLEDLKCLPFVRPSFPEQTAIAEVLSDMDAEIALLEQRLAKTRNLKQGMMQELLTGKTRLI